MKQLQAIIFDLDGTLWDSRKEIQKTWNLAIEQNDNIRKPIDFMELSGCLGLPMDEIARRLFPNVSDAQQKKLMDDCCALENDYLSKHGATLFPSLKETLAALQEKYQLYIVSNCQCGYIEAFLHAHHLESYFNDIECWGNTNHFKGYNIRLLMERNHITNAIYVGDTQGDADASREAGIPFVFCQYGFGSVEKPDAVIHTFADLIAIQEKVPLLLDKS